MLTGSMACASFGVARAAPSQSRRLAFTVWREKQRIGQHSLVFSGDDRDFQVEIVAAMAVSIGPLRVFQYRHQATEMWRGGDFSMLTSHTVTNGRSEQVSATRSPAGVAIRTLAGSQALPADTLPLTHWNSRALAGRLFNPQTGASMHEKVSRGPGQILKPDGRSAPATVYALSGDAEIADWYDADGVWSALRAKARDGSFIEYRRVA
jgi:hypothetical protein